MPLTAMIDGQRVDSVLATDEEWAELKRTYAFRTLVMACGLPAFPRTPNLKVRHFVHKTGVKCCLVECWAETPQHRAAKSIVARAARDAGWNVTIEHPAPDRSWIADVHAEKADRRIALEIQWSKQTTSTFASRQERYASAGIECFWFVHRRNQTAAEEARVPHVVFDGDGLPLDVLAHKAFQEPERVPLAVLTRLLLDQGYLDRVQVKITDVTLELTEMNCTLCMNDSTIWRIGPAAVRSRCQQTTTFRRASYSGWPVERLERSLYGEVFRLVRDRAPLAPLRMHYSKTASSRYLAYGCAHCERGFFGDFFITNNDVWDILTVQLATRIPIDEELLKEPHICEDKGFGRCSQEPQQFARPVFEGHQAPKTAAARIEAGIAGVDLVGETISARDAISTMFRGTLTPPRPAVTTGVGYRPKKVAPEPAPGTCDQCGTDPHPEFECLRNQLRTLLNVPAGTRHYSDDVRDRIISGDKPLYDGTELLRRCLQRSLPLK